ncbi:TRAP dicarboxylate transporter, DctM subunit, unknown substrate 6, partial [hydrothermal vent metagenome]
FAFTFAMVNRYFKLGILSELAERVVVVLMPPLALIFLVLGTIFLGIATPTEGGAMGATGALIMALTKRRLNFATLNQALVSTTKLSAFVMFILIGARIFGLTFFGVNGNIWIEELLLQLPGGQFGFLMVVTILIFILGMFLDFFEIAFIMVPLLVPVAEKLGIDLIWFGIILGINLQTSFLTPPFGFALFYLRSIAPKKEWLDKVSGKKLPGVKTLEIYKGAVPYIIIQFIIIVIVIMFPGLVTHYKGNKAPVDINTIEITVPSFGGALDNPGSMGPPGSLQLQNPSSLSGPPSFGNEPAQNPPPANGGNNLDLTQPPVFN